MMSKLTVLALLCLWLIKITVAVTLENPIARSLNNYEPDIEPYEDRLKPSRPVFNYRKNGVKIDVRIVPATNNTIMDDRFPEFPARDLTRCMFDLSMSCFRERMARFIDTIGRLDEITLWGTGIKLVKTKALPKNSAEHRMLDVSDDGVGKIDRSIENFFDSFALRISLPRSNGKRERNQIDVMFDDNEIIEGRGKKGGGGGGKGGGKCKKMMMMVMMMGKMKLMAMAGMMSMKGMMMAGMSLMISKAMLIMKLMSLKMKGGGGGGGGGGHGGGGGQLKEIVLLTKAGGGGGGGGSSDSYGAPPPSSYGPPASGGGGYDYSGGGGGGGGGGWGRSFDNRLFMSMANDHRDIVDPTINSPNFSPDYISPSQPMNDLSTEKRSTTFNDSKLWNRWQFINSTDDPVGISTDNSNFDVLSYNTKNKFEAFVDKTSEFKKPIENNRSNAVRANYARKWKNYEIADRIINPGTPIIAIKRTSRVGRESKSIPIAV